MTTLTTSAPQVQAPQAQASQPDPCEAFHHKHRTKVRAFYDTLGEKQLAWNKRFAYYRKRLTSLVQYFVRPGSRVLDIGCGTGDLLTQLRPSEGIGIDCSSAMIDLAKRRHPLKKQKYITGFAESLDELDIPAGPYDYVTLINTIGEIGDIGTALRKIHRVCSPETRVIIVHYNYLWEPICRLAAKLGLKLNNPTPNWLAPADVAGLLHANGFETVRQGNSMPLPIRVPGLNWIFNSLLGRIQGFRWLGFASYVVARPKIACESPESYSCSVVVPCKNEEDNIAGLIDRIPDMGSGTEIIFVDDQSDDATAELVLKAINDHPERNIKLTTGPGNGKGAACRAGFAHATGDVLMILDADMTVMPEQLPAFFHSITTDKGEFINGSRMVYPLEDEAMRPLNILGNKMFATLFTLLLEQRIRDTLCGTKVIWKRDYPKIMASRRYFNSCDLWGDYDWIFGAAKNNLKIIELPVHYRERTAGVTKMNKRLRNAAIMLRMCGIALRKVRWL